MPAKSLAQRRAMAIAAHRPDELFERNKGLKEMKASDLKDFISTRENGLPRRKTSTHKR